LSFNICTKVSFNFSILSFILNKSYQKRKNKEALKKLSLVDVSSLRKDNNVQPTRTEEPKRARPALTRPLTRPQKPGEKKTYILLLKYFS